MSETNGHAPPPTDRAQAILDDLLANAYSMRRDALGRSLFDPRRDVEEEVGAPRLSDTINPEEYQQFYERDPIAARVVEVLSKECWQVQPSIYEVEEGDEATPFEAGVDALSRQSHGIPSYYQDEAGSPIMSELKNLDILAGIGHYGAGLLGLDDGLDPREPARPRPGQKLLFLRSFPEYQAVVIRWENDVKSPRHGQPLAYNVTLNDPREDILTGIGLSVGTHQVHWTRIVHVADTWHQATSSKTHAPPRMRCVWNNLLGLHKMYAGDPEAYWKNSLMKFFLSTHPQLGGDAKVDVGKLRDQLEPFMNGMEQYFMLKGMTASPIAPTVTDPTPHLAAQIEAICIKLGCPVRIFKGSERGELASGQDDDAWNDRLKERQQSFITPRIVCPFIDRLIWLGVLPAPSGYSVWWPDLTSQSEAEKATVAATKVGALVQYIGGQGESVLPPHVLLTWLGEDDESAAAILDEATGAIGDDGQEEEGLPDPAPEQESQPIAAMELDLNCGGKGGKPGPCPEGAMHPASKAAAGKASKEAARKKGWAGGWLAGGGDKGASTVSTPAPRKAAAAPKASGGAAKKPATAKIKAAEAKVAKVNAKVDVAKKKLSAVKAELKTAKTDLASLKASVKGKAAKGPAGVGAAKLDEHAKKISAIETRAGEAGKAGSHGVEHFHAEIDKLNLDKLSKGDAVALHKKLVGGSATSKKAALAGIKGMIGRSHEASASATI